MAKIINATRKPRPAGTEPVADMTNQSVSVLMNQIVNLDIKFDQKIKEINSAILSIATHLQDAETPTPVEEVVETVSDWNPEDSGMLLWDKDEKGISWQNHYKGSKIFLVCSGPSLNDLDLTLLDNRGVMSMAINNAWSVVKPDFWIGFDVPGRFHDGGWKDPSIMKIVPWHNRKMNINHRVGNDLVDAELTPMDMPNCWFLSNHALFNAETFFTERHANWGGKVEGLEPEGGFRVTMIGALRTLYYLGFQEVYLLGCDWEMPTEMMKEAYAWEEDRAKTIRSKNNDMYKWVEGVFKMLQPGFDKANFRIYNCNRDSKLTLFPFVDYEDAIERCTAPEMKKMRGWYNIPNERKSSG